VPARGIETAGTSSRIADCGIIRVRNWAHHPYLARWRDHLDTPAHCRAGISDGAGLSKEPAGCIAP
jgi:hypothetical protein